MYAYTCASTYSVRILSSFMTYLYFLVLSLFVNAMQVPIPALKEQIATVTGVLSEQQRLICRGKVLKDDQLLSAYRIHFLLKLWKLNMS